MTRIRRVPIAAVAGLAAIACTVAPAWSASGGSPSAPSPSPTASSGSVRPSLTPRRGKPFVPSVGDWEGTANGFPASFQIYYQPAKPIHGKIPAHSGEPYKFNDVVALRPGGCPPAAHQYSETVITSAHLTALQPDGSLSLSRLGFDGSLTGRRSASLSTHYRATSAVGACSGRLTWRMHPAHRQAVQDGLWRLRYADGELSSFHVMAGGRLASAIAIPSELTRCNGTSGRVDVFVAPDGRAGIRQRNVQLSVSFSRRHASGKLNGAAPGCSGGPLHFSASLKRSGA